MRSLLHFITRSWPLLAFGFLSIFWGNLGQTFFISWYGAGIQQSLGLSAGFYGGLYSAATLASSVIILSFGGLIDRWPLRRFATVVAVGLTLACLLLAASNHYLILLAGFFMIRLCGQGLMPHTAQTTMARYLDSNRGKALSISASGVPVGEIVLPILAVALITGIGWQGSWLVFALSVPLLYLPLIYWLLKRSPVDVSTPPIVAAKKSDQPVAGRREMLTDRRFWMALPTALSAPFILTGLFIHQSFILEQKDWSAAWLATCFIMLGAAHWVSSLTSGLLIDRFTARRLMPFLLLPLMAAMACVSLLDGNWAAALLMSLLGVSIGSSSPVMSALWAEVYGTGKLGSIRSLMTAMMMVASSLSPILFGILIDAGVSAQQLFGSAGLGIAVGWVMVFFSYKADHSLGRSRA
ncbi:MFS transporter [Marinimicrobium alkaliphilum]|uniref:MFS transporter n=1 Tax=Marinimicrobium alkaliphilum TaxID=2202654 RepID=UPI0018E07681|nr:MFS transporter [Marinimicrobium alkaliphilum]